MLASLVFVVVGLVLLIIPDPQFRLIFSGATPGGFSTTRFTFGNGTIPRNFTGFNFTRGAGGFAARNAFLGFNTASIIESILGAGLVSVGVVLMVVEMFLTPSKVK